MPRYILYAICKCAIFMHAPCTAHVRTAHTRINPVYHDYYHRWPLSPISTISDIGLSLISEPPISDWESGVWHYIGYRTKVLSDIRHPFLVDRHYSWVVQRLRTDTGHGVESTGCIIIFFNVEYWNELWCQYRNTSSIGMTVFSPAYLSPLSE